MSRRGPIATGLVLFAATTILSACTAHHSGHGTVYRPHHDTVRTRPVQTRTTAVTPHRGRYGSDRYRRDRHGRYHRDRDGRYYRNRDGRYYRDRDRRAKRYPRQSQPGAPATAANRPNPPAHGVYGTQPGHLKRQTGPKAPAMDATRTAKGHTGRPAPRGSQNHQATKQPSSILKRKTTPPKSAIAPSNPNAKSGLFKGKQPNAHLEKSKTSGS